MDTPQSPALAGIQQYLEQAAQQDAAMRAALTGAKAKLIEQGDLLDRLTSAPFVYATVFSGQSLPQKFERGVRVKVAERTTGEIISMDCGCWG